jgi:hypothetical protein
MSFIPVKLFNKHSTHEVYVDLFPKDKHGNLIRMHHASLRCRTCNKWIKWLTLNDVAVLEEYAEE